MQLSILVYIGQTGGFLRSRYREHVRYIKTNNPNSAYVLHILNNRHENGNMEDNMQLLKICIKGLKMNYRELFFYINLPATELGRKSLT